MGRRNACRCVHVEVVDASAEAIERKTVRYVNLALRATYDEAGIHKYYCAYVYGNINQLSVGCQATDVHANANSVSVQQHKSSSKQRRIFRRPSCRSPRDPFDEGIFGKTFHDWNETSYFSSLKTVSITVAAPPAKPAHREAWNTWASRC